MADHTTAQYIYGETKKNWKIRIAYTYTQNTTTAKTTCVLTLQVYNNNSAYNKVSESAYYKLYDNTTNYQTFDYPSTKAWRTLGSKTVNVTHDSEGKGSLAVSGSWYSGITGSSYTPTELTIEGTITFDNIPVASSVKATNAYIGSVSTITISANNSGYKHTLSYSVNGGSSYTTIASNVASSYSWTLPLSLYNSLGSMKKSLTVTIKVETFSGSTSKGSKTCTLTATAVESDCKALISSTIVDNNSTTVALTGDSSKFIKYFSNAQITVDASARCGASISSIKVTCGTKTLSAATGTINAVESGTFVISVTDSRGFVTTLTVNKTLIEYIKPTISLEIENTNANGSVTYKLQGNAFQGSIGTKNNEITLWIRYKEQDSSTWEPFSKPSPFSYDDTKKQYSYSGTFSLDYTKSYAIQACISDTVTTTSMAVWSDVNNITFIPMFYWGKTKFKFNVPVTFTENVRDEPTEMSLRNILDDIYISDGETMDFNFSGGGYITTAKKQINFVIPLRKSGKYVNKVTINSFELTIRQNGNYIYGDPSYTSSVKTAAFTNTISIDEGYLNIKIVKSSEFSASAINNAAIGVYALLNVRFGYDSAITTQGMEGEILDLEGFGNEGGDGE